MKEFLYIIGFLTVILFVFKVHIVENKETLSSIIREYDLDRSPGELAKINGLSNPNKVPVNRWLIIDFFDLSFLVGSLIFAIAYVAVSSMMSANTVKGEFSSQDFIVGAVLSFISFIIGTLLLFTEIQNYYLPLSGFIFFLYLRSNRSSGNNQNGTNHQG